MAHDLGGWMWLFITVGMVAMLAVALIYGSVQWRRWRQHPIAAEERDRATKDAYRQ